MARLNHTYRLIWSDTHNAFIAVAEFARARGKRASSGIVAAMVAAGLIAVPPAPSFAANLPTGGQIVAGQGTITQSGTTMTITQATDKMAANWQSFSIGKDHAVNFVQPSSSAIALNRVLGSDVSVIQGGADGQRPGVSDQPQRRALHPHGAGECRRDHRLHPQHRQRRLPRRPLSLLGGL